MYCVKYMFRNVAINCSIIKHASYYNLSLFCFVWVETETIFWPKEKGTLERLLLVTIVRSILWPLVKVIRT